jgi:hypothetical protein
MRLEIRSWFLNASSEKFSTKILSETEVTFTRKSRLLLSPRLLLLPNPLDEDCIEYSFLEYNAIKRQCVNI